VNLRQDQIFKEPFYFQKVDEEMNEDESESGTPAISLIYKGIDTPSQDGSSQNDFPHLKGGMS